MGIIVTTSLKKTNEHEQLAEQLAAEFHGTYVPRQDRPIASFYSVDSDLVVVGTRIEYYSGENTEPFFFHPSMGYVRAKRFLQGDKDVLLNVCRAALGDSVLDATLGLGADALLLSLAVGSAGKIRACESHPIIGRMVEIGLASFTCEEPEIEQAARRIEVTLTDHLEYLKNCEDRSIDIIYFDPMFRKTFTDATGIMRLRSVSDARPLSPQAVEEAKRVARKRIVLKERKHSGEFERLGFTYSPSSKKIAYGVIECAGR